MSLFGERLRRGLGRRRRPHARMHLSVSHPPTSTPHTAHGSHSCPLVRLEPRRNPARPQFRTHTPFSSHVVGGVHWAGPGEECNKVRYGMCAPSCVRIRMLRPLSLGNLLSSSHLFWPWLWPVVVWATHAGRQAGAPLCGRCVAAGHPRGRCCCCTLPTRFVWSAMGGSECNR